MTSSSSPRASCRSGRRFPDSPSPSASQDRRREQLLIRDSRGDVGRDSVVPRRHGAVHRADDAGEVRRSAAKSCIWPRKSSGRTACGQEPRRLHEREADALYGAVLHPALERVIKSRGMEVQLGQELVALRPDAHEAVFRDVKTGTEQVMRYDMIHVTPPLSPPEFVRTGPLANADGWIEVDKFSLQHVRYPEVFSLGDASNLPTSKTGAAIRKQAPVVVENLLARRAGQPLTARYDGYTSCPVVTGRGKLIMAEFNYAKEPVETFPADQRCASVCMRSRRMLPRLYWHGMLRGRA